MKAILSEAGFAFSATEYARIYGNDMLLKMQKKYTIRTVDRTTKIPQVTKLYKLISVGEQKIIELPRFIMRQLVSKIPSSTSPILEVENMLPAPMQIKTLSYSGQSNPNQQTVVNHIVNEIFAKDDVSGVTLKLLAGQGKTYCAMDIISKLKLKTLVVVPNTFLLDQWIGLIRQYFPGATIGTLYGKQKQDGDIIIGIINTVCELKAFSITQKKFIPNIGKSLKYMKVTEDVCVDSLFQKVGLTIFDESQMYVSKEFCKVFSRIHSRYTIGLSATPDNREDKLDVIHQSWLGPILDAEKLDGFNVSQDSFESDVHLIEYHALNEHCKFNIREDGMIDYSSIIASIISDPYRNHMIIDNIVKLMKSGLFVFVFSDRRSHLENLYELLKQRSIGDNIATSIELPEADQKIILYGGATECTIDKAKKYSTVIFTTYSYAAIGISAVRMNALVLSTPRRSNMKQIINRVFRLGSDQTIKRIIVDICDAKLPIKGQIRERIKAYHERGSFIKKIKVNASDEDKLKLRF